MRVDYNYTKRDNRNDVPYSKYRETTQQPPHPQEAYPSRQNGQEGTYQIHRRVYQPPEMPHETNDFTNDKDDPSSMNIERLEVNKGNFHHSRSAQSENRQEFLTNDHAFFTMASKLLSLLPDKEDDERFQGNCVETAIMLQKVISPSEMRDFSEALDIRFNSLPRNPSPSDTQLMYIIRRCEKRFGKEMKDVQQASKDFEQQGDTRRGGNQQGGSHQNDPDEGRKDHHTRTYRQEHQSGVSLFPSKEHIFQSGSDEIFTMQPPAHDIQNERYTTPLSDGQDEGDLNDFTGHILSDEIISKSNSLKGIMKRSANNNGMAVSQQETMSTVSSSIESEVYDMILDAKHENLEDGKASNKKRSPNTEDNDDISVASSYSVLRSNAAKQTSKNRRVVKVMAPETLPENIMFEARLDDEIFMVHVPPGGVKKGEIFESVVLGIDSVSTLDPTGRVKRFVNMNTPMMRWRDTLFDCFAYGLFHPMVMNSFFAPGVALVQVMSRMQLNNSGNRASTLKSRVNTGLVKVIPLVLLFLHGVLAFLMYRGFHLHLKGMLWFFIGSSALVFAVDLFFFVYFIRMLAKTRRQIREEYNIHGTRSLDFLVSLFCAPCAIAQMGRHTADYDTYIAAFCTSTGLPEQIEVKLPSDEGEVNGIGVQV